MPVATSFEQRLTLGRGGDRAALEELFGRWRPLLRLLARNLLGSDLSARLDPGDIVQEALAQAFEDLDQFRGRTEAQWVAWLRHMVAGHAAKARRHHHAQRRDAAAESALDAARIVDHDGGPPDQAMDREEARRLSAAIEKLPEPMREVLIRRVIHHEPFETVASKTGCSPGAARVLWTRALRCLRETLASDEAG